MVLSTAGKAAGSKDGSTIEKADARLALEAHLKVGPCSNKPAQLSVPCHHEASALVLIIDPALSMCVVMHCMPIGNVSRHSRPAQACRGQLSLHQPECTHQLLMPNL